MIEPIVSLAFSLHANKGVYALLLGSGVSRSSGIPTGWEVVKDLINKVAHLYKEEATPDPETWYRAKFNEEANYSRLLDALAKTPPERNKILRSYFEANEEEREQRIKVPTSAHHAIANLVSSGHIRVVVTTNFDRLMESALESAGINPSIIDSPDKIEGALPLTHSPCTVIKLHGDYMDLRIKNTPEELAAYDERMNKVLDQVLDEYGLIICGWSADYDVALEGAISRCPSRRFTTYWTYKDKIGEAAKRLIDLRHAERIQIESADAFFQELAEKLTALEEYDRPHPISVKVAIATEKKFLEEEKYRIRLHDLVMGETDRLLTAMSEKNFPTDINQVSKAALLQRMAGYDAVSEVLLGLIITGCYWSDAYGDLAAKGLERIANPSKDFTGSLIWTRLRWYPAMLLMYAGGIASLSSGKYENLAVLLTKPKLNVINKSELLPAAVALRWDTLFEDDVYNLLTNSQNDPYALNRHLFEALKGPFAELLPIDDEYQRNFNTFEYLLTLIHADLQAKVNVSDSYFWGPRGLFMSERERRNGSPTMTTVKKQAEELRNEWPPLKAGLFDGSYERFEKVLAGVQDVLGSIVG
jgi:NAD-dependent SIR2 family protein deacetylase